MKIPVHKPAGWWMLAPCAVAALYWIWPARATSGTETQPVQASVSAQGRHVDLSEAQARQVHVETVREHMFVARREAVGNVTFNDDRTVPVFPAYAGKISGIFTDVGRDVRAGDPLYSLDSPDLLQAESTLISAAGVRDLTGRALERAQQLFAVQGLSQKDLLQAISDQQGAEAAYKAARDAVRIFGKSEVQIDRLIAERRVDATMLVRSPISGQVVARSAAPGTLAQPGTAPAPFTVADTSVMWMIANVPESDLSALRLGQAVEVTLLAYPDRTFQGKITNIGALVDANTHRISVRSEVRDPDHKLRSGMLANFLIQAGNASNAPAVPSNSVVREGDGTMTAWVTEDHRRFFKRTVTIGLQQDGLSQVLSGLKPGETVASDGAIFLSHAYNTGTR